MNLSGAFLQLCEAARANDCWIGLRSSARKAKSGPGVIDGLQVVSAAAQSRGQLVQFRACTLDTLDEVSALLLTHMGWAVA